MRAFASACDLAVHSITVQRAVRPSGLGAPAKAAEEHAETSLSGRETERFLA
jgi:hypothetical protein